MLEAEALLHWGRLSALPAGRSTYCLPEVCPLQAAMNMRSSMLSKDAVLQVQLHLQQHSMVAQAGALLSLGQAFCHGCAASARPCLAPCADRV